MVQDYEKLSRKLADNRNHLRFNLRCRQHRVTLISIRLSSNIRGHRAEPIVLKAQNQLLNKRIRQVHFTTDALIHKMDLTHQKLSALLPNTITEVVYIFTKKN